MSRVLGSLNANGQLCCNNHPELGTCKPGLTAFLDVRNEEFVSSMGIVTYAIAIVDFIYFISFSPSFSCMQRNALHFYKLWY